jgi:hypothetical protein
MQHDGLSPTLLSYAPPAVSARRWIRNLPWIIAVVLFGINSALCQYFHQTLANRVMRSVHQLHHPPGTQPHPLLALIDPSLDVVWRISMWPLIDLGWYLNIPVVIALQSVLWGLGVSVVLRLIRGISPPAQSQPIT